MQAEGIIGLLAGLAGLVTAVVAYRKSGPESTNMIIKAAETAVNTTIVATDHQAKSLTEWIAFLEGQVSLLQDTVETRDREIRDRDDALGSLQGVIAKQERLINEQAALIRRYENELDALRGRVNHLEDWIRAQGFDPEALH